MTRIGILAGGGRLPLMIAESVTARGGTVHIVGIEGEADPGVARFPHTWVNWGQIGRMVATLRSEGARRLVIAGAVTRPDLWRIRPDVGFFRSLPQILRLLHGARFEAARVVPLAPDASAEGPPLFLASARQPASPVHEPQGDR